MECRYTDRSTVAFAVGRDIGNANIVGDISKLPHVLIAGTTGSGNSMAGPRTTSPGFASTPKLRKVSESLWALVRSSAPASM